jgi:hypothetical protein
MPSRMDTRGVSRIEARALAELALPIITRPPREEAAFPPEFENKQEEEKWYADQQAKREKWEADSKLRQEEATTRFQRELDERLAEAYEAGAQRAVSAEARRAVAVRGYVLLGVVAAVVSMPLIGMLLKLDPDTFGAFIAPVTGIAGTIVGYWFGTVGQVPGQGTTQPPGKE